jgi:hypothetical protein
VPFIRYSRDKRGYESTFVMHAYRPTQGAQQTRVLYMFRSLAHLKIGRKPLDPEVVEALEHTHPDLSFDWTALLREPAREAAREDARARLARGGRQGGRQRERSSGRQGGRQARPTSRAEAAPVEVAPEPKVDDQSLLGRVLGAKEAARLRGAYTQMMQRVASRARNPEDRDRLTERAARLNPEEWSDEATVTAEAQTVQAAWDAIIAELPSRRRGRRGGRRREAAGEASGIMAVDGNEDAQANEHEVDRPDRAADGGGPDGGPVGEAGGPADPVSNDD